MAWYFWGDPTFSVSVSSYSFKMAKWWESCCWGTVLKCLVVVLVCLVKIINRLLFLSPLLSPTLLFFFFPLSVSSLLSSPPTLTLVSLSARVAGTPCRAGGQEQGTLKRGCRSSLAGWELPARHSHSSGHPGRWWDCPRQSRTIVSSAVCHRGIMLFWKRDSFRTGTI